MLAAFARSCKGGSVRGFCTALAAVQPVAEQDVSADSYKSLYYSLQHAVSSSNLSGLARCFTQNNLQKDALQGTILLEQLLHACARTGDVEVAEGLLQVMELSGMPITPWAHKSMLHALSKRGKYRRAMQYLEEKVPRHMHSSFHYVAIARYAEPQGCVDISREVLQLMEDRSVTACSSAMGCLLMTAASTGGIDQVEQQWWALKAQYGHLDLQAHANRVYAITRCIESNSGDAQNDTFRGDIMTAAEQDAPKVHMGRELELLRAAFQELADELRAEHAGPLPPHHRDAKLLRKVVHNVIAAASRVPDSALAGSAMGLLSQYGLSPCGVIYAALMALRLREASPPCVLEDLMGEMMGFGHPPGSNHFLLLLEAYALHGMDAEAEEALQRAEATGVVLGLKHISRVLYAMALSGNLPGAMRMYQELKRRGIKPDVNTFAKLFYAVRTFAIEARIRCARSKGMLPGDDRQGRADVHSTRAAELAAAHARLVEWQVDMLGAGLRHDEISLAHLTKALDRLNEVGDSLQLVANIDKGRPSDLRALDMALRTTSRLRSMEHVGNVFKLTERMKQLNGGQLTGDAYRALLLASFWLHRDPQPMLDVVDTMREAGQPLDQHTHAHLIHAYCSARLWGGALRSLDEAAQLGPVPDSIWHVCLRDLVSQQAPPDVVLEFVQRMDRRTRQRFSSLYRLPPPPPPPLQQPQPQLAMAGTQYGVAMLPGMRAAAQAQTMAVR